MSTIVLRKLHDVETNQTTINFCNFHFNVSSIQYIRNEIHTSSPPLLHLNKLVEGPGTERILAALKLFQEICCEVMGCFLVARNMIK